MKHRTIYVNGLKFRERPEPNGKDVRMLSSLGKTATIRKGFGAT